MQVSLKKQRFVNWVARCGWYPISISMTAIPNGDETVYGYPENRIYLTPHGGMITVVLTEDMVIEVKTMKTGS